MILQNPWGLLLLLSIPVLVVIYLIKQDYRERSVSSTYLWHLSEKFRKKHLPLRRMTALTALVLQLSMLALLALAAARPAVSLGQIAGQIVVIDASASMQTEQDGVSRFESAVEQAKELAQSGLCSSMTVIVASDTPACLVTGGSAGEAIAALEQASCGFGGCNTYEAMRLAREACARMGSAKVTFYTDTRYAEVENVEVVDMNRGEKNVAITALTHGVGTFEGVLVSYGEDREVTVGLEVDGEIVDTAVVFCTDGEPTPVRFATGYGSFGLATLFLDGEDALACDDYFTIVGNSTETVSVLVLGEETLFFEEGLRALGNCDVTVEPEYDTALEGAYDLYIFSGCIPEEDIFPENGVTLGFAQLWPRGNFLEDVQPLSVRGFDSNTVIHSFLRQDLTADPLLEGMDAALADVSVQMYVDTYVIPTVMPAWMPLCGVSSREPMGLVRELENGARHYLFMFPISETNLAMTPAFLMLLQKASTMALPPSLPQKEYTVGETVEITLKEKAEEPTVHKPDGSQTALSSKEPTIVPTEPGLYMLTYKLNKHEREAAFFVHIPVAEYETYSADTVYFSKPFEESAEDAMLSSETLPLAVALICALLILEWGYYYRGKR